MTDGIVIPGKLFDAPQEQLTTMPQPTHVPSSVEREVT